MNKRFCISTICSLLILLQPSAFAEGVSDSAPSAMPSDQGLWQTMIMIVIALAFFYLILWRPEQKRRKEAEKQRNSIKKGDKVTAMGILGTVVKVQDQTLILRMVDGSKIEMLKAAVNEVIPAQEGDKAEGTVEE